jgi:tetratricopeptide (TPR) repeat protein
MKELPLGLFGKKKTDETEPKTGAGVKGAKDGGGGDKKTGGKDGYEFNHEKAEKFFERAATLHEATNFEFAMTMWLGGLRQDPTSLRGLEGFFKSAGAFMNSGAKGPSKDTIKLFSGGGNIERYLLSLLEWSAHPTEAAYAVRAMQLASDLGLAEPAVWIATRALGAAEREKRPRKDYFLKIMEVLRRFEKFDLAIRAGEAALRVDPTDGRLSAELRNMSADSTMRRGGFDQTGAEGGFRANIRDIARQQELEEASRVSKTEEALNRLLVGARSEYEANKLDKPTINKYVDLLLERGQEEDEQTAIRVLDEAYRTTQEFRFKDRAEQLRLRVRRRGLAALKERAEAGDPSARESYKAAVREYLDAEIRLAEQQVAAYPTDLSRRFDLGQKFFKVGRYEEAIGQFQEAKNDVKNRANVLYYLGLSFQKIGWNDEAIETLRQALSMHASPSDATGMELRYALMEALAARAEEQSSLPDAEEAYKIAASIAIEQINYKQIRARRDEVKQLAARLRGGAVGGGGGGAGSGGSGGGALE